jgi:hypothetical protein
MKPYAVFGSVLLGAAIGCSGNPSQPSPLQLGEPFELRLGERAAIAGDVSLVFVNVASDSRCPSDATCVSDGEALADVLFIVRREQPPGPSLIGGVYINGVPIIDGQPATVPWCVDEISQWKCRLSTATAKSAANARPFTVRLVDLKPPPRVATPIARPDYVATFVIGSQ